MTPRPVRIGAAVFFLLFALAVTWPGMIPFNRIEPQVLGLPFSMFWIAVWIFLSFLVLLAVDRVEENREEEGGRLETRHEGGSQKGVLPGPTMGRGE